MKHVVLAEIYVPYQCVFTMTSAIIVASKMFELDTGGNTAANVLTTPGVIMQPRPSCEPHAALVHVTGACPATWTAL